MPSYQEIYAEVQTRREESSQDFVLKKYLKKLNRISKRPTILYASAFTEKQTPERTLLLGRHDASCFAAASAGLEGRELDLILHSPGGSVPAVEQLVGYLRRRYDQLRIIVPECALSSAVLLCCAADRLIMGEHATLGPIDPVVSWVHQGSSYCCSAQEVINEFAIAQRNINNKKNNPIIWIEKLKVYTPGLLAACKSQIEMAQAAAKRWLETYMFHSDPAETQKADEIVSWLSDSRQLISSSRPVMYDLASAKGLKVELLDDDDSFADSVMAVFFAASIKFRTGDCVKLVANHLGKGCTFTSRRSLDSSRPARESS